MIHIKELFRLQDIQHLRLIAGRDGLERTVTAAVLFEYDPSRVQLPDFYRGDLVVTTLAYARGDAQLVAHSLQALMNQGIASLMVKTAYFSELPQSVIALANRLGTPVFLFDDTYIEEVILQVTDLIRGKRHFSGFEQDVDALMRGDLTEEQTRERARRIDPALSAVRRQPQGARGLAGRQALRAAGDGRGRGAPLHVHRVAADDAGALPRGGRTDR